MPSLNDGQVSIVAPALRACLATKARRAAVQRSAHSYVGPDETGIGKEFRALSM